MGVRNKAVFMVVLVLVLGGVVLLQTNTTLFKGQLIKGGQVDPEKARLEEEQGLLPDLKASLEVLPMQEGSQDITVKATIENAGQGTILNNIPFKYTLSINGDEVFSNTDSYTSMDSGDAFSFNYPISKAIYQYPAKGDVSFEIDTENAIKESDEKNNEIEVAY